MSRINYIASKYCDVAPASVSLSLPKNGALFVPNITNPHEFESFDEQCCSYKRSIQKGLIFWLIREILAPSFMSQHLHAWHYLPNENQYLRVRVFPVFFFNLRNHWQWVRISCFKRNQYIFLNIKKKCSIKSSFRTFEYVSKAKIFSSFHCKVMRLTLKGLSTERALSVPVVICRYRVQLFDACFSYVAHFFYSFRF